jgi:hypothetical protein
MKGVLLLWLMSVCVDKKLFKFLFVLLLIIVIFFMHMVHEKQCKNTNLSHNVLTFWELLIRSTNNPTFTCI